MILFSYISLCSPVSIPLSLTWRGKRCHTTGQRAGRLACLDYYINKLIVRLDFCHIFSLPPKMLSDISQSRQVYHGNCPHQSHLWSGHMALGNSLPVWVSVCLSVCLPACLPDCLPPACVPAFLMNMHGSRYVHVPFHLTAYKNTSTRVYVFNYACMLKHVSMHTHTHTHSHT